MRPGSWLRLLPARLRDRVGRRLDAGRADIGSLHGRLRRQSRHEIEIRRVFGGRVRYDGSGPVLAMPLLVVAFTNRSGSNLLCDYLAQTGRISLAGEFLNHDAVAAMQGRRRRDSFPDHIAALAAELCPRGRQFALKASFDQMVMLLRWNVPAMFPAIRVLHVRRHDMIAQAVSLSVATQTRQWTSRQAAGVVEPQYRPEQIERILAAQRLENQAIEVTAQLAGLPYLALHYEDLLADPKRRVDEALGFCGLAPGGWQPRPPRIERQLDPAKDALLQRFLGQLRRGLDLRR